MGQPPELPLDSEEHPDPGKPQAHKGIKPLKGGPVQEVQGGTAEQKADQDVFGAGEKEVLDPQREPEANEAEAGSEKGDGGHQNGYDNQFHRRSPGVGPR